MDNKAGPWRLTGLALAQLALFVPTIVVLVFVVLGASLAIITVGIPILLVSVPALHWLAGVHRSMAATTLGHDVPAGYLPTEGQPVMRRLQTWALDPMTWRELALDAGLDHRRVRAGAAHRAAADTGRDRRPLVVRRSPHHARRAPPGPVLPQPRATPRPWSSGSST